MTERPLVSVIVPAYNHAAYIEESLASIAAQTYPNIETIVVDDGSRDATRALAEAFAARSPRPVRVVSQPNAGTVQALLAGWRLATGEVVSFLASDDALLPHKVEEQMRDLDAGADAVYGGHLNVYPDGREEPYPLAEFTDRWDPEAFVAEVVQSRGPFLQAGLFRRSLIESIGGLDQGFKLDDWPLNIRVARAARRVVVRRRPVLRYRYHAGNLHRTRHRDLLRWKLEVIDAFCAGRLRRQAKALAHLIYANAVEREATGPWLRHLLLSNWYAPAPRRLRGRIGAHLHRRRLEGKA